MRLAVLCLVIACGPSGTPVNPTPPDEPTLPRASVPLDLTVRVRAERDKRKFGVAIDDTLKSGDFLDVFVTVSTPAYIYVVQFFPDGTSAVLFPQSGDLIVKPGVETKIPQGNKSFQLDDTRGEENVYVLASLEPVATADAKIAGNLTEIRTSGDKPEPAEEPPVDAGVAEIPVDAAVPIAVDAGVQAKPPTKRPRRHREERLLSLATRAVQTRKLLTVTRPDGDPETKASIAKGDDALIVVRFSFQHE